MNLVFPVFIDCSISFETCSILCKSIIDSLVVSVTRIPRSIDHPHSQHLSFILLDIFCSFSQWG